MLLMSPRNWGLESLFSPKSDCSALSWSVTKVLLSMVSSSRLTCSTGRLAADWMGLSNMTPAC